MTVPARVCAALVIATIATGLVPSLALATTPGLQIAPLQYEDILAGKVKNGHIDVANPTDSAITIQTSVRGFEQTGQNGDLRFFDDPDLARAIKVDLASFELGPREAVRVLFSVDPAKLPAGGTYAVIFFTTTPAHKSSSSSYISQSANVGTLLLLRNGGTGVPSGGVTDVSVPLWQFGRGLTGTAAVRNTAPAHGGAGFHPALEIRVLPWAAPTKAITGLVLPGSTRRFDISRPGAFFGLLPLTVTDTTTGTSRTAWIVACTGFYSWVVLVLGVLLVLLLGLRLTGRLRPRRRPRINLPPVATTTPAAIPDLPVADPRLVATIEKAEAKAPGPGTLIMPEPSSQPFDAHAPVHPERPARKQPRKVEIKAHQPAAAKPPVQKPVHKVIIKPKTTKVTPVVKPSAPKPKPKRK